MPSLGEILRGVGSGLKRAPIGDILMSGMAAAATPNVAGGGPTDTIRGIMAGVQYPEEMRRQRALEEAKRRSAEANARSDEAHALLYEAQARHLNDPAEPKYEYEYLALKIQDPSVPEEQKAAYRDRMDQLTGKTAQRAQDRLEKAEMERLAKQDRDRRDTQEKAAAAEERKNRDDMEARYRENRTQHRLENPPGTQVLPPDVEAQRIRMSKASRSGSTGEAQARFNEQQLDEAVKEQERLQAEEQKQHALREQLGEALKTPEGKTFIDPESLMSDVTMTPARRANLTNRLGAATRQVEFLQRRQKAIQAKFGGQPAESSAPATPQAFQETGMDQNGKKWGWSPGMPEWQQIR